MTYPPAVMRIRVKNERRGIILSLPLFVLWPVALVLLILIWPIVLVAAVVVHRWSGLKMAVLGLWAAYSLACSLRGLLIDVKDKKGEGFYLALS